MDCESPYNAQKTLYTGLSKTRLIPFSEPFPPHPCPTSGRMGTAALNHAPGS